MANKEKLKIPNDARVTAQRGKLVVLLGSSGSGKSRMRHPLITHIAKDTDREERKTDIEDMSAKPGYYYKHKDHNTISYNFNDHEYWVDADYIEGFLSMGLNVSVILTDIDAIKKTKELYPECIVIRAVASSKDKTRQMMIAQGRTPQEIEKRIAKIDEQNKSFDGISNYVNVVIENDYTDKFDKDFDEALVKFGVIGPQDRQSITSIMTSKGEESYALARQSRIIQAREKVAVPGDTFVFLPYPDTVNKSASSNNRLYCWVHDFNAFPKHVLNNTNLQPSGSRYIVPNGEIAEHLIMTKTMQYQYDKYMRFDGGPIVNSRYFALIEHMTNAFNTNTPITLNATVGTDGINLWYGRLEDKKLLASDDTMNFQHQTYMSKEGEEKRSGSKPLSDDLFISNSFGEDEQSVLEQAVALNRSLINQVREFGKSRNSSVESMRNFIDRYSIVNNILYDALGVNVKLAPDWAEEVLNVNTYLGVMDGLLALEQDDKELFDKTVEGLELESELDNIREIKQHLILHVEDNPTE